MFGALYFNTLFSNTAKQQLKALEQKFSYRSNSRRAGDGRGGGWRGLWRRKALRAGGRGDESQGLERGSKGSHPLAVVCPHSAQIWQSCPWVLLAPQLVTMCACGSVSRLQGATPQLWSFFCILRLLPISFLKYIVFLQPI